MILFILLIFSKKFVVIIKLLTLIDDEGDNQKKKEEKLHHYFSYRSCVSSLQVLLDQVKLQFCIPASPRVLYILISKWIYIYSNAITAIFPFPVYNRAYPHHMSVSMQCISRESYTEKEIVRFSGRNGYYRFARGNFRSNSLTYWD